MLDAYLSLNIYHFMLVMARMGTAIALLPGFSATYVSPRIRLLMAAAISAVLTPMLSPMLPNLPDAPATIAFHLAIEVLVGAFFGALGMIAIAALQTAGTVISLSSVMANAFIMDPISEQQGAIVSNMLQLTGITLVFVTDLHHLMLAAIVQSYDLFPATQAVQVNDMALLIGRRIGDSFELGIRLAGPFLVIMLTYNLGLGLLNRLMQQLPIFFVGIPIQISIAFFLLMVVLAGIMGAFLPTFQAGFDAFIRD